jgi:hypothetical protein
MKETDDPEFNDHPETAEAKCNETRDSRAETSPTAGREIADADHNAPPDATAPVDQITPVPEVANPAEAACQDTPPEPETADEPSRSETMEKPEKPISEMSAAEKGAHGEHLTKIAMEKEGYREVGSHVKPQGIDSVWEKGDNVVLVETKFRTNGSVGESALKHTAEGQQTSMEWTFMKDDEGQPSRFREACGNRTEEILDKMIDRTEEILDKMIDHGYATRVAVVDGQGSVKFQDVDTQAKGGMANDEGNVKLDKKQQDTPDAGDRTRTYFH